MLIAHADWSLHPRKRWLCVAREIDGGWAAEAPIPVGDLPDVVARLREQAGDAPLLLGIDTPVGLPIAYAERAGIASFRGFLANDLGRGPWDMFAIPAVIAAEISLHRPFYPFSPGKKGEVALQHLVDGLGLTSVSQLRRACELASDPLPGILFWTLGAKQTGKAALRAWTELIRPALADDPTVRLWPFDGELAHLLSPGRTVIAETYPAAAMRLLDIEIPPPGKTSQFARMAAAPRILEVWEELAITPSAELAATVSDGFGPKKSGEDSFDALLGLLGMVAVATGDKPTGLGTPDEPDHVRTVEGWILGVPARPTMKEAP